MSKLSVYNKVHKRIGNPTEELILKLEMKQNGMRIQVGHSFVTTLNALKEIAKPFERTVLWYHYLIEDVIGLKNLAMSLGTWNTAIIVIVS